MKYTFRESLTGSGNWFVESDSDGHWGAFVALVRSETLARQIAAMLESGALRESLHVPQTPDTGLGAVIGKWPGAETDAEVAEYFDCDTPTIRDAEGRVVHRAGNDRTYMPGDDVPEM